MLGTILEVLPCFQVTLFALLVINISFLFVTFIFTSYWYIPLLYLVWYFYDRETPYRAGRSLRFLRNLSAFKTLAAYFPAKLHKTVDLDPSKNYIFAAHPHGLFVFGAIINVGTNATGFDEMFPGLTMHMLSVNIQFKFPLHRELTILSGVESVSADSIDYKLTKLGPGHSVFIAVGGGAEVRLADPSVYTCKLKTRKGFIRRALKTGASVVPVIIFNEHRLYDILPTEKGSIFYYYEKFVKLFSNEVLPLNVRGRWWWSWFLVPKKLPIDTVIGAPIDFVKIKSFTPGQEPSADLVDECHQLYLEAYRKLYDDNKARFGDENTPLVFV